VEAALVGLPEQLTAYKDSHAEIDTLRNMASSAYHADFDPATSLSQRVLLPVAAEENHGMEDARFVRFTDADGSIGYRATYTAYDGYDIAPRPITSPDLASFAIHRLSGSAAHNKGMESRGPPTPAVALCILWQCNAHRPEIVEVSVDNLKEVRRWDPALVATQMGTQNAGDQRSVVSADQPPSHALVA